MIESGNVNQCGCVRAGKRSNISRCRTCEEVQGVVSDLIQLLSLGGAEGGDKSVCFQLD